MGRADEADRWSVYCAALQTFAGANRVLQREAVKLIAAVEKPSSP